MYIGDTSAQGLHHLVREIVENSLQEVEAGLATRIEVQVGQDESITIADDGRGIPIERDDRLSAERQREFLTLEGLMTLLKYPSPRRDRYHSKRNPFGVGLAVVNFLNQPLPRRGVLPTAAILPGV